MSFTSEVKDELSRVEPVCPGCDTAELSALVRFQGTLSLSGGGRLALGVSTEKASVARTVIRLLHTVPKLRTELTVRRSVLHKTHNYLITVPAQAGLDRALGELGIFDAGGLVAGIEPGIVARPCCAGAYLRGAFLAGGYIADPRGDSHFEITASSEELACDLIALMARNGITARSTRRHSALAVYIKGAEQILAFLAFVGAEQAVEAMSRAREVKSVRNDTNRRVNAELANHVKAANASMQQIEKIRQVVEQRGVEEMPASLREVALLRLRHPDASLKELGEFADPPLSKSAVNHRLRRISAMLEQ